ncbi:hypothetical protein B0H19DRAFT_1236245 [Mycena capillaripes]|nr:hypothetical protein B0H19DRAFT_1236245 [Mycena capillaripes]
MTLQALSPSFQDIASGSKLTLKTHQGPSQETPFKIFKSQSCTSVLPPISRRSPLLPRCLLSRPAYSMIVGDHKETHAFFHFLRGPPDFAVPPQYIFGSSAATFPPPAFHLLGSKKLRGRTEPANDPPPSTTSRRRPDPPDCRTTTTGLKPMSTSRGLVYRATTGICATAFMTGAADTWRRFGEEFNADGIIAKLTALRPPVVRGCDYGGNRMDIGLHATTLISPWPTCDYV